MTSKFRSPDRSANRSLRNTLLIGASLGSLMIAGVADAQAGRGMFGSRGGTADPAAAAARAAQAQAQRQAQTSSASQRAIQAFRRAADTRTAMSEAQRAARAAAQAAQSNVPNGLGQGGLQVAEGVASDPSLWVGANGPVQSEGENGRTNVTIEQTEQKAILTWDSFNVGRETDLAFRQGGSDWVALNRVTDASADPTQILGSIKADGSVYILNRNGVIFGGASQVNVRNLVAASANITNEHFLERGIYSQLTGTGANARYQASFTGAGGAVTVEAGAQITTATPASVTSGGGFVLLMGSSVTNAGSITTPRGQAALSAGDDFIIRRGFGTEENPYSTTRGNEVRGLINADSASGTVINAGQIEAAQGDITLAGRTIRQDGVLVATTSVNQRGTIHLLNSASETQGSVTLGKDSLTLILPELDSTDTALNGQRDALIEQSNTANGQRQTTVTGGFDDRSLLADRLDQSRVEIVTGGSVLFEGGSQTMAQGGQVAVQANAGRITVADGARIDVSGVMGVALNMEDNSMMVNIQGNEMRDSPANRDEDHIRSQNVWIDVRDLILLPDGTGGYDGDRWYTPGGLLEVGGWLDNRAHMIGEWSAVGGIITLAASEIVAHKGAVFDISGGSLDYASGWVRSTRLMGADGRMYDIRNAPAHMKFVAIGNAFMRRHERWGEQYTEIYANPLFSRGTSMRWEDGYSVGRDAGKLILSAPTIIMEADLQAEVINGSRQTNPRADNITDGYKLGQHTVAHAGTLAVGRYDYRGRFDAFASEVRIGEIEGITGDMAAGDAIVEDRLNTVWLDAGHLNAQGLGGIDIASSEAITVESALTLADGGSLSLTGPIVDIAANVTAVSGHVTATNILERQGTGGIVDLVKGGTASIVVREGVTLDLRGAWLNGKTDAAALDRLGFLNGGSVLLETSHDLTLEKGSVIDVSSGAAVLEDGSIRGGRGGDVTLGSGIRNNAGAPILLDGVIRGNGVLGGGTLTISSGSAVGIGAALLSENGVLKAGEKAPVPVALSEDLVLPEGMVMDADLEVNLTVSHVAPGEPYPLSNQISSPFYTYDNPLLVDQDFTVQEGWLVYGFRELRPGLWTSLYYPPGTFIPANTRLRNFILNTTAGQPLPEIFFPNGYTLPSPVNYTRRFTAGETLLSDTRLPAGTIMPSGISFSVEAAVTALTQLKTELFQSGFSNYAINGRNALVVTEGTDLAVQMPVLRVTDPSATTLGDALTLWTPPAYLEDPINGVATRRLGAGLTLATHASVASGSDSPTAVLARRTGMLTVEEGARITVDDGQSVALSSIGRLTMDGTINAHGGRVSLHEVVVGGVGVAANGLGTAHQRAISVGGTIDVSGRAFTATANNGRRYGVVLDGGSIEIGGTVDHATGRVTQTPHVFVDIREGALLDASGAGAVLDLSTGSSLNRPRATNVASHGGSISIVSGNGLYLDGTLRADAGGEGAAKGSLTLALEAPAYRTDGATADVLVFREMIVGQDIESRTGENYVYGEARISADSINGRFDDVTLFSGGSISFENDVALNAGKSINLYADTLTLSEDSAENAAIRITAPYVRLAGASYDGAEDGFLRGVLVNASVNHSTRSSDASFTVDAGFIDARDFLTFGANQRVLALSNPRGYVLDRRGFDMVSLQSRGDIRLLAGNTASNTMLRTDGDMLLSAAQVYPATHAIATIAAGFDTPEDSGRNLTIRRPDGMSATDLPPLPLSVFGKLSLFAPTVDQHGTVRAPLGAVELGDDDIYQSNGLATQRLTLHPGSITSASAAGLVMPYGGTVDGIEYSYDGSTVTLRSVVGTIQQSELALGVQLAGVDIAVEEGALIDLSGGGELAGAGFVSGRGGSVDVLRTAFANANPGYRFSDGGNAVYAIVPGYAGGYAPVSPDAGAGDPAIGRQVTIPEGVPGLPAGTYTLLPSTYALMPGAFRVELGAVEAVVPTTASTGTGSFLTRGYLGHAGTGIRDSLASRLILTPADVVRQHTGYNEMSYGEFVLSDAQRRGLARAALEADGKQLFLSFNPRSEEDEQRVAFSFEGEVRFDGAKGGYGGAVSIFESEGYSAGTVFGSNGIEVLADGAQVTEGFRGLSLYDSDLAALNAPRLVLGGRMTGTYGVNNQIAFGTGFNNAFRITLRSGSVLQAAEVFLLAGNEVDWGFPDGILIEQGATINTIGQGDAAFDATNGYYYSPGEASLVAVSNGSIELLAPSPVNGTFHGIVDIGGCEVAGSCVGATRLYSEGTIGIATVRDLALSDTVRYGTRNLALSVGAVNAGSVEAIEAARAEGRLPAGMTLNQTILDRLLRGDQQFGAPALESLTLTARDAISFFGDITLSTIDASGRSSLENLVLTAPALYGYGAAGDVARIETGNLIWNGASTPASLPVMQGAGRFEVVADTIEFGYADRVVADPSKDHARLMLGFADVHLNASQRVTANHSGSLAIHQTQGEYVTGEGFRYSGGNLRITTPVLTTEAGAKFALTVGEALVLDGAASDGRNSDTLGGTLSLEAARIDLDTTIALASGRLTLKADGDINLGANAHIDMSGRAIRMHDVTQYSWGGDAILESRNGNIVQAAGSTIDLSAQNNQGGKLSVTALADGTGIVDLQGTILGSASGYYDAGGTRVPYLGGGISVRARTLGGEGSLDDRFAALNVRLTGGEVFGERSFQFKEGSLIIGDGVRASVVNVSVDGGSLTVNGTIDASGERVGSIRLAARDGLTLAGSAVLDAHGSMLRVDSYGKIIDSPNRAVVELNSGNGELVLASGARIDLRHGTAAAVGTGPGQHDGEARGTLTLNAPRLGGAIGGDIAIDASGSLTINGARAIAINAVQRYDDAPGGNPEDSVNDRPYQVVDQAYLDAKHAESTAFISAALQNGDLLNRKLAGLNNATYADALHLRPGVEIVSAAPDGDIVIRDDIDLSGHRYASINPGVQQGYVPGAAPGDPGYGSGEAGALTIRAGGDLAIYGTVTDGFTPVDVTVDNIGPILANGKQAYDTDVVIPRLGISLQPGSLFPAGVTLNYALPFESVVLPAGTLLPGGATLDAETVLPAGTILPGAITGVNAAGDTVTIAAGQPFAEALTLAGGTALPVGTRLSMAVRVRDMTWPAGVPLPANLTLSEVLDLKIGALIPAGSDIRVDLPEGEGWIELGSAPRRNWAVAPMLPEESQSWDMRMVAGADLAAADTRMVRTGASGNLTFADAKAAVDATIVPDSWRWDSMPPYLYYYVGDPVPAWAINRYCPQYCTVVPGTTVVDPVRPLLSMVRTGVGDLDLIAGGDVDMRSPFGVYTAGVERRRDDAFAGDDFYLDRGRTSANGTVLGAQGSDAEGLVNGGADSLYRAWYPDQGGNLLIAAGGDLNGEVWSQSFDAGRPYLQPSASVSTWLWRQGTGNGSAADHVPTAWWINFGTYTNRPWQSGFEPNANAAHLTGFTGFGTLGGGNVMIDVAGEAGAISQTLFAANTPVRTDRSNALVVAVGSTGRVLADGSMELTGGGDLTMRIGGSLNDVKGNIYDFGAGNNDILRDIRGDLAGAIVNLRGSATVQAGSMGEFARNTRSASVAPRDARATDPYAFTAGQALHGIILMPGDSRMALSTRGDLVVGGAGDAGRVAPWNATPYTVDGTLYGGGQSSFSLWTHNTAIDMFSAGGNAVPTLQSADRTARDGSIRGEVDYSPTDARYVWPSRLSVVAASGNVVYGGAATQKGVMQEQENEYSWLLAPNAQGAGYLSLLAGGSIYGGNLSINRSGAPIGATSSPFRPAFVGRDRGTTLTIATNYLPEGVRVLEWQFPLFAFGSTSHGGAAVNIAEPGRFYAVEGDIVGLSTGQRLAFSINVGRDGQVWHEAAGPVRILAGGDIVGAGTYAGETWSVPRDLALRGGGGGGGQATGNLIVHNSETDVSVVQAGGDIIFSSFQVAGPGPLEITAGGDIRMEDRAFVTSLGAVTTGDTRPGASIAMAAGMAGVDWQAVRTRYLDPANLADPERPLADPLNEGKAAKVYDKELVDWLGDRYGFAGSSQEALAYFDALAPEHQRIFLRQVYFAEAREGGREYNNPDSPRFASYLRGREMIGTLFPDEDANGTEIVRTGDIVMFGGSGVRTNFGGDIEVMAPGGQIVIGVQGEVPPASAGLVTQGTGDIRIFSEQSLLLGLSRILTTFGGDIFAWSEEGDINAGRGARTTILYTPPRRTYDNYGNVALAPQVPSSGAGIGTLNPIPEVAPGDVDLIAPLGTIDAGEAGIRVSGNINLAALQVLNAANIQVQGDSRGIPLPPVVNTGALAAASNASTAVVAQATQLAERARPVTRPDIPVIFSVRLLGFGE